MASHGVDLDLSSLYADVSEASAKRTFMKKIEVGGKRIFEVLLSEEMVEQFAEVKRKEVVANILPPTPSRGGEVLEQTEILVPELELVGVENNAKETIRCFVNNAEIKDESNKKISNKSITNIKSKHRTSPPLEDSDAFFGEE